MKLGNRTFLYSLILSIIVGGLVLAYMIFMVPSLYADYTMTKNLNDVKSTHLNFVKSNDMDKVVGVTKDNVLGFIVADEGYEIDISSVSFKGKLTIEDPEIRAMLDEIRLKYEDGSLKKEQLEDIEKDFNYYFDKILKILEEKSLPIIDFIKEKINLEIEPKGDVFEYERKRQKGYISGKNTIVLESSMMNKYSKTEFLSYLAMTNNEGQFHITMSNMVMPNPDQIKPVMINALYVLIPLIFLLSLGMSTLLSKKIVQPIEDLAKDADSRRGSNFIEEMDIEGDYEIRNLKESLNLLYKSQAESMDKLKLESEKKEVFMRAFSHQLKNPLASSSLLVDGMTAKVGKFADRDKYLPQLKNELNSMKRILARILDANNLVKEPRIEAVNMRIIGDNALANSQIKAQEKNISLKINGEATWTTDGEIIYQILDNLVTNAVLYTSNNGSVDLIISNDEIAVKNKPATIEESLKPVIFEAFVTGEAKSGHGLGLYVVKHFADSLNMKIDFETKEDEVSFILKRKV